MLFGIRQHAVKRKLERADSNRTRHIQRDPREQSYAFPERVRYGEHRRRAEHVPEPRCVGCVSVLQCSTVSGTFRYPTFADKTLGFGRVRGPMRWNVDLAVSKLTRITERVSTRFDVQFVNAFNHVMFGSGPDSYFSNQPGMDLSTPGGFGVPSNQFNSPRYIQMGLRFDF